MPSLRLRSANFDGIPVGSVGEEVCLKPLADLSFQRHVIEAVKETVRLAGVYLTRASWAFGVFEALQYFELRTSGRESACA